MIQIFQFHWFVSSLKTFVLVNRSTCSVIYYTKVNSELQFVCIPVCIHWNNQKMHLHKPLLPFKEKIYKYLQKRFLEVVIIATVKLVYIFSHLWFTLHLWKRFTLTVIVYIWMETNVFELSFTFLLSVVKMVLQSQQIPQWWYIPQYIVLAFRCLFVVAHVLLNHELINWFLWTLGGNQYCFFFLLLNILISITSSL